MTDLRLIAAFYRYPELFQELRNANYRYWKDNGPYEDLHEAESALYQMLGSSALELALDAIVNVWDEIDSLEQ